MLHVLEKKMYITIGIFALVILSLILFLVVPLLTEVKNNSEELISIKNSTALLQVQNDQIESFKKNYQEYKPNLEKMDQLFIDAKNPVDFIEFLEATSVGSEVLSKISLVPMASQKDNPVMVFQLFTTGDYGKFLHFLEKLENGRYVLSVEDLKIANSAQDSDPKKYLPGKIDATFAVKALIKK